MEVAEFPIKWYRLIAKEEIEMQNSLLKSLASLFVRFTHSPIHRFTLLFLILALLLPSMLYAAPQQSDYCYLPPFVTDPNTPPNVMIVFERSDDIMKRAYATTYNSGNTYYGFFYTNVAGSGAGKYYKYNTTGSADYFQKETTSCTISRTANCFEGNILNWALMSSIDVARKALVGFGWPDTGASSGAGDVFTYSGDFNGSRTPVSYGQWEDGNTLRVTAEIDTNGDSTTDFTYSFCLSKFSGSNPTGLTIRAKDGGAAPSCTGSCSGTCTELVNNGQVAMKFSKVCSNDSTKVCTVNGDCSSGGVCQEEVRYGIIQKYADKNQDYTYDSDAPRFGMRRWCNGADKQSDILCDCAAAGNPAGCTASGNCTSTSKTDLFKTLLNAISKAPPNDGTTLYLGEMMEDIVDYFSDTYNSTIAYQDNDAYTQTTYSWSTDPAQSCRKTAVLFLTTGANLGTTYDIPSLHANCSSLTYTDSLSKNACHAYNSDLSSQTGTQNIRTYVVHTNFISGASNTAALTYASRTVGGGEYVSVSDAATLTTALEEIILNILSTSASASTVATLTTQTRESSTLTQAYFYPKREGTSLRWIGYLRLMWSDSGANLREDTANTGWLDVKKDRILAFFYDPSSVSYRAKTYLDSTGDLKIDSCTVTAECSVDSSGNCKKNNDDVSVIWNAQSKFLTRSPNEGDSDYRNIKIGIGNTSGVVTSSQMYDFTTARASTLQPFWNYASYCSNVTTRWCASNNDCNFCNINTSRTCPSRADSACYYCSGNTSLACPSVGASGAGSLCYFDYSPCGGVTAGVCDGDSSRSCAIAADCIDDYGTCTTDTCNTYDVAPDTFTCSVDCNSADCATSVIKYIRGFDNPSGSTATAGPGGTYRIRHKCPTSGTAAASADPEDADCPAGTTCSGGECKRTCSAASDCSSGETCTSGKCESGKDVTGTLKLGDIVYSTPRISPNSAVNGYDVTYTDTTYRDFINKKIKGTCTQDIDCPSGESCTNNVCTGDGYSSIVVVGANDGMVHAFKVSKIRDISPAEDDCYADNSCDTPSPAVTDGSQTARFADKPHSAKTSDSGTETDTAPPSDIGKEVWAYIPFNAVPYLRWYCSKSYCHIPMVDARFTIIDASIDYDHDGVIAAAESRLYSNKKCESSGAYSCPNSSTRNYPWRRLLIGAMGAGGKQITVGNNTWSSSVFVLDITNPASPTLLWERPLPDGTLTTSTPVVVRLGSSTAESQKEENGKWYLVIGSGPTSIGTNTVTYKTSNARIFVFDLRTGENMVTDGIDIGASNVAVGDLMAVDMDSDYQVDNIYFGTYGGAGGAETGKFYRLRLRADTDASTKVYQTTPSTWDIETVVNADRPIYAAPEIASDSSGNIWLYFGTGVYLSAEHASQTTRQEYLYGLKETEACWKGLSTCASFGSTTTPSYTAFLDTTNTRFTGAKATELGCFCAGNQLGTVTCSPAGTCGSCSAYADTDTVVLKVTEAELSGYSGTGTSCNTMEDTAATDCLEARINSDGCGGSACNGWKRAITGEKMFSRPFVAGGLVDFTSFKPSSSTCSLGGNTYLWSLHYTTGTAYAQPTIFVAGGTSYSALNDIEIKASVDLGIGVPPLGESLVALPLAGDTYKVITQVSGGLPGTSMAPSLPARSGYVLWIVK